jgi:outer membrane protein TolC
MTFRRPIATIVLLFVSGGAHAQSLDDLLAIARTYAPSIQAATAEVSRADQAIREARAALSPTLRLNASYTRNSEANQTAVQFPGAPSAVFKFGSANVLDARLIGEYSLYSGGRNGALVSAARAAQSGKIRDRDQAEADLVFRVSQAYYRAVAAQKLQAAAEEAVASARAHRATSAARVKAGVAPRLDSLRAYVDLAQRASGEIRASEAVRISRVELETAIGAPLPSAASGALTEPPRPALDVPDVPTATQRALRDRPELQSIDEALRESELREAAARAALKPQLNLDATAQYLGPNRDEDWWNPNDAGLRTHKFFAGVGLSMPIYDAGLNRARVGQVAFDRVALEARRREIANGVRREVEQAVSDLRVAQTEWQSDSGRVVTAREALRIAEAGYKGGSNGATDVRDAESALADARAAEAQSSMNYWIARAAFDRATGAALMRGR